MNHHNTMTSTQIQVVHDHSLALLERTGILIEHPRALELLAQAGAGVNFAKKLVKIPGSLVETCLQQAPASFHVTGRKPDRDFRLAFDSFPRARPVLSLDWIVDVDSKKRRAVTLKDLQNWVRLGEGLPNLSLVSGIYPWDVAVSTRDVYAAQVMIENSDKPILIAPYSGQNLRWIAKLLSVLPDQRPSKLIAFSSCNSPLIFSESQMDVLLTGVSLDLPVMINSSAVTGATAPVTLAGSLVLMNAEILAGICVAQLARPGSKVLHCGHPVFLDMRTGAASCGYTEAGLLAAALVEMGQSYHLPTGSNGVTTDAHICDSQAAVEKLVTCWPALQSGASLNGGAGSLAAVGTCSLEQMAVDDDIYERLFRNLRGIQFDEDTLASEVMTEVGPLGQYLDQPHTLRHLRKEWTFSRLAWRQNPETWLRDGGRDALEAASLRVKEILSRPNEPRYSEDVLTELNNIAHAAEVENAGNAS